MTPKDVANIVRDAKSNGFVRSESEFVPYLLRRGITLSEYEAYEIRRTRRHVMVVAAVSMVVCVAMIYLVFRAGR